MKFVETPLTGAYEVLLDVLEDERGSFCRTFCKEQFGEIGHGKEIVQINHSVTKQRGTVRGMHYQAPPACEIKLLRCVAGKVYDVIVDIRQGSPTFLQWHGVELSGAEAKTLYIPEGLAHGFQVLDGPAHLIYHHTAFYNPACERGLRFDDPRLAIGWPLEVSLVSDRDRHHPLIDSSFMGVLL